MPLTLEDIAAMITSNKKEILSKVDEIVEDVKEVKTKMKDLTHEMKDLTHRVETQEETNAKVNKKIELLQSQISNLKDGSGPVKAVGGTRSEGTSSTPLWPAGPSTQSVQSRADTGGTLQVGTEAAEIMDVARRTVGLNRIDREDIERMKQPQYGGATTEKEAKLLAVKEYLRCELKIDPEVIETMAVENIFEPEKERDNPQSLNVTFQDSLSVSKIFEKTRIMRRESRIINYIPRQFNDRARAIAEIDYNIRLDKNFQTRIKMGWTDLELHKKIRGTKKWEKVPLPDNLPPVNLRAKSPPPAAVASQSPPPGRPRLQSNRIKRGRDSSGSETEQTSSKVAKQGEVGSSDAEENPAAEKVTNTDLNDVEIKDPQVDMTGKVVEEESYCPASPAPVKPSPAFIYNSPVFRKSKSNPDRRQSII